MLSVRRMCFAAALAALIGLSSETAIRAESLDLLVGSTAVRVSTISPVTFRISLSAASGPAGPESSLFIDPALKPADLGKPGAVAGHRRLSTPEGSVEINPALGTMSLLDSHGAVLIPPASIATLKGDNQQPMLNLHVGWPHDRPFAVYGSGNGTESLLHDKIDTRLGNGVAVEPFFWTPAGFAEFVVGSDDNAPARCDGKIESSTITWTIPGKSADLYLIIAPTLGDASRALLQLTGRPPVPPRWTMGYMQSRWGWVNRAYIEDALQQFNRRKLPIDAFIFDFEWYTTQPDYAVKPEGLTGFSDFGWNRNLFPDPAAQIQQLHDAGLHFVGIRKPRLGNAETLAMIRKKGWGFRSTGTRVNESFDARGLWFADPDVRAWYAERIEPLLHDGVDGWWNDEGEFTYSNYLYWNMAERTALNAVRPTARFWTINRAFRPGLSRLGAAAWTGDVGASWHDLARTPTDLLNWSVAGMPFAGCDIGGFAGETTPELFVRWMEAGTFFPVMRAHSEVSVKPHFPWLFGDDAQAAIRRALDLRYRLIPLLYSLAYQTHETGEPIMRPLIMQYPTDSKVSNLSSEWLIGENLLAGPMLAPGNRRTVYLPDDIWYDFGTGRRVYVGRDIDRDVPFDTVPLYIRAGTILPLAPLVQHTRDLPGGPLEMNIYTGRDGTFKLVEDDGSTTAYLNGVVRRTTFSWDDAARAFTWKRDATYSGNDCFRSMHVILHDGNSAATTKLLSAEYSLSAATGTIHLP